MPYSKVQADVTPEEVAEQCADLIAEESYVDTGSVSLVDQNLLTNGYGFEFEVKGRRAVVEVRWADGDE